MRVDLIQQDRKKRLRSLAAPALTSNHGWRSRGNLWTFVNLLFLVSVKFVSRLHTNYWSKALEMPSMMQDELSIALSHTRTMQSSHSHSHYSFFVSHVGNPNVCSFRDPKIRTHFFYFKVHWYIEDSVRKPPSIEIKSARKDEASFCTAVSQLLISQILRNYENIHLFTHAVVYFKPFTREQCVLTLIQW